MSRGIKMSGAAQLRAWRMGEGLTLKEAGDRLGMWYSEISRYEHGHVTPSIHNRIKMEDVCDIPIRSWH